MFEHKIHNHRSGEFGATPELRLRSSNAKPKEIKSLFPVNSLTEFEIWSSGYTTNSESHGPFLVSKVKAKDFNEAVKNYYGDDKLLHFDGIHWSYWGCRLASSLKELIESYDECY